MVSVPIFGGQQAETKRGGAGCEKESGDSRRDAGGPAPGSIKISGQAGGVRGGTPEPVPDFEEGQPFFAERGSPRSG